MDGITDKRKTQIRKNSTQYIYQNNILYRKTKDGIRKVILREQIEPILYHFHTDMSGAHLGIDAIIGKIKDRYYWPQLGEDVKEYIKTCDICQRRGPTNRREELIPIPVKGPFHRIGIDIKGPLPITSSGNRYIIVAMDYFTKWPEARAISNIKAETVAKFIYEEIICRHGVPQEILSDRGTSFMNKLIDELCENYQTKHRLTSAYRPQTNGMVERFNRTIGECIAKLVQDNNKEWDQLIDAVLLAYRTKKHNTTGKTPFYLTYGREATLPIDLKIPSQIPQNEKDPMQRRIYQLIVELEEERNDVSLRIEKEQAKQKQVYDQQGISEKLKIGDQVLVERTWLKNNFSAKLENKWIGPYFIHEVLNDNVYKLRNLDGKLVKHVIHGNRLKKYHERKLEPIVIV
ncbi:putative integrase core domain protein [Rhizophagus irregularis DAOM 181602=DAOM 197198]|uniref:Gag-pol fusion protein n=2 Tax=Rhizophagus irregularis TaxID=588596 RepID=A0A015M994_RHIIW|nr:gag-pol fusion protein [Rhizophagus irregularis DAOM 197198w]GBC48195.1 putative integrase core domain protein [Rhizophagus irregularis DAOM 181602=DAOM 197198]